MTALRRAAIGVVIAVVLVLAGAGAVALAAVKPTDNVTGYGSHGQHLPPNPDLQRGSTVTVVVTGYLPGTDVTVRIASEPGIVHVRAGADGSVRYRFTVPLDLPNGQYVLVFAGAPASAAGAPTVAATATASGDVQGVVALVPLIGKFPYRASDPGGHGVGGTSTAPGGPSGHTSGHGVSGLSHTGADVIGGLALALLTLVSGVTLLVAGRSRRGTHVDPPQRAS